MNGTLKIRQLTKSSKGMTIPKEIKKYFDNGTYLYKIKKNSEKILIELELIVKEETKNG